MSGEEQQLNEDYWKFAESERHFNETQSGIRNLASGWMLAAFAAIALLLKTDKDVTWLVSPAVLVGVVSFMATLGLLVLWINDQLVYQRLLGSNQWFILIAKKIGGLTITIFLITFGAPFWNDILNALVGITRTSFKKGQGEKP